jgi:hypothetical protein
MKADLVYKIQRRYLKEPGGMDFIYLIFLLILIIGYAEFLKNPYES